jgi:hypothetical protein
MVTTHTPAGTDLGADRAFWLLRIVYTVAPIAFGLDKFVEVLSDNWEGYLAPWVDDIVPGSAHEAMLIANRDHWLANEILLYWKRVLKRVDLTSRSLVALVEPGSCFAGVLAELLFAVDRSYMAEGDFEGDNRPVASILLT